MLEIGCGTGFQSALLSCISDKVIASDINTGNMIKHSLGLDVTRNFLQQLPVTNVEIINANAERLPFDDETFDFIYSSFSFQYIQDKAKALGEIKRVLKKDGSFFCILPTTAYTLSTATKYYTSAFKKIIKGPVKNSKAGNEKIYLKTPVTKFKRSRLLPPPDDESNNFFTELFLYSPGQWRRLFKKNNHVITYEKRDATSIIFMTKKPN